MKLLFKQKMFSWFDSYDIYDEAENVMFTVKGQLSWGHCLKIYDAGGMELGTVQERVLSLLPKFEIIKQGHIVGTISKELSLFKPKFNIDYKGWRVEGDWLEWDYCIQNRYGGLVANVSKQLWKWTDTYTIDVENLEDTLDVLMLVLAIDAEKCSRN